MGEARALQQRLKEPVYDVLSVQGFAVLGGEHEAVILPLRARP